MFRGKVQRIHFVGIGGTGMCGIAEVLLTMGYTITGSDMQEGQVIERLRGLGGHIQIGHTATNVSQADVVVKSTAIPASNVEIRAAEVAKIPVIPRAEMLGELMRMKYGIAVAGSHGKTTTTSMIGAVLFHAELDPTIVIGGRLDAMGSSARLGAGDLMVAEADESDGSFLLLDPTIGVITSIDPEHMDHWRTLENLHQGFVDFANKVPFFGFTTVCLDHPVVQDLLPRFRRRFVTYGLSAQAEVRGLDLRFQGMRTTFKVTRDEQGLGELTLGMPGQHNVCNALAAISIGLEIGLDFGQIASGLNDFSGVDRRFTVRDRVPLGDGSAPVTIIDDYGHHPAEISATLTAASKAFPDRRVIAVFQPHRYSRVLALQDDFARSFNAATHVVVCPIYRAGEKPIPEIHHHGVAQSLVDHGHRSVVVADSLDDAVEHLALVAQPGDVVITLGAGDVNRVCTQLSQRLRDDN
jgi:UDP-N-acetylmuramate--alanine ligase